MTRAKSHDLDLRDAEKSKRGTPPGGLPPNEQLKRHPDEVYGDTDVPSHNRDDASKSLKKTKKGRS
jgi:hypothetical protein